ncbi:MAG: FHA domain-containing protein [Fimbriimonadales bacterium]|jgi:pSer/pThr/pTyr-binding forkhead associated (FHA) protein|nr:FHA domain-containing protein [Fimbriimonadales bacterium]
MAGQRFSLPVELGRESVQIPMGFDSMASRRHARIEPSGMMAQVVDLGSTNGTFINGVRVQQQIAKIGDEIKVGSTTFRIESQ